MTSIYRPLKADKAQIRLLRLEPATCLDYNAVCSLHLSSLDDEPSFEALSYCWGDSTITKNILLDGVEWPVTVNLEAALRYLRHSTDSIILWVDAICINQQDVQERNSQVAMMGKIYSSASTVRVWLGESADASDQVMQAVHKIVSMDSSTTDVSAYLHNIWIDGRCLVNDLADPSLTRIPCVDAFADRPWWERIWVLQEVLLARSAIVHCGSDQIPMQDFFGLDSAVNWLEDVDVQLHRAVKQSIASLLSVIIPFKELHMLLPMLGPLTSIPSALILRVLANGWGQKATDPRDKIYGMLGIMPGGASQVQPRYDWLIEEVYTKHTLQLIDDWQSLSIFDLAPSVRNPDIRLPSWVPDWSVSDANIHQASQHHTTDFLKACGDLSLSVHVVSDTTIRLRGVVIAAIEHIGDAFDMLPDGVSHGSEPRQYQTYLQWLEMCGARSLEDPEFAAFADGALRAAFCQTISKGIVPKKPSDMQLSRTTERLSHSDLFSRWWNWLANVTDQSWEFPDEQVGMLHKILCMQNQFNRFFVTYLGNIGTAPYTARPGDIIYVLGGGGRPYVLRPILDALQQPAFTLVGPCYLNGFMMGEAILRPPTKDNKLRRAARRFLGAFHKGKHTWEPGPLECHDIYLQ